jgi:hypothetical protein
VTHPEIVLAVQVNLGAIRDSSANACPRSNNASCAVDGNLATSREAVVSSVVTPNESRVVSICTYTAASHWVSVAINSCGRCEQRDDEVAHRG